MSKLQRFFSHIAIRAVLCASAVTVISGGLWYYVQSNGGFVDPAKPQIMWLNTDNSQAVDELKIQQDAQGNVTANPDKPVLLVECPREACETADLDLAGVTKALDGKVIVLALDPYADRKFASAFESLFITGQVMQQEETQLAENLLASQGQAPTPDMVASLLSQKQLKDAVDLQAKNTVLMKPAYPKFYLFNAQDFSLVFAGSGISTRSDLLAVVNDSLSAESNAGSTADGASPAGSDSTSAAASPVSPGNSATVPSTASVAPATSASSAPVSAPKASPGAAPASAPAASAPALAASPADPSATTNNPVLSASHSASPAPSIAGLLPPAASQSGEKTVKVKE